MSRRVAATLAVGIWALFFLLGGITYYVNHHMPRGPSYPTGEIVCQNDERGPCGEEHKEDMRGLDIPEWAKLVREHFVIALISLLMAGVVLTDKATHDDDEDVN